MYMFLVKDIVMEMYLFMELSLMLLFFFFYFVDFLIESWIFIAGLFFR